MNDKVLFIGGHMDGKRMEIDPRSDVIHCVPEPETYYFPIGAPSEEFMRGIVYRKIKLSSGDRTFSAFVHYRLDADDALECLVSRYRPYDEIQENGDLKNEVQMLKSQLAVQIQMRMAAQHSSDEQSFCLACMKKLYPLKWLE